MFDALTFLGAAAVGLLYLVIAPLIDPFAGLAVCARLQRRVRGTGQVPTAIRRRLWRVTMLLDTQWRMQAIERSADAREQFSAVSKLSQVPWAKAVAVMERASSDPKVTPAVRSTALLVLQKKRARL